MFIDYEKENFYKVSASLRKALNHAMDLLWAQLEMGIANEREIRTKIWDCFLAHQILDKNG